MRDDRITRSGRWLILIFFLILLVVTLRSAKNSRWDGKSRLSLILSVDNSQPEESKPLVLFSIEPRTSRAVYLVIPGNTILTVPYGYREYLASSVYKLGQLDKIRGGGSLLVKSIENTFGVLINGYLVSPDQSFPFIIDDEKNFKKLKPGLMHMLNNIRTDIGLFDRLKLWWEIRKLRTDQIGYYDLNKSQFMEEVTQPDGSVIKKLNKDVFDTILNGIWEDSEVRRDNVTLEVVNATEQEKVAGDFSDILSHLGATIILTSTDKTIQKEKCLIYLLNPSFNASKVITILQKNYNCRILSKVIDGMQTDVRIILGENFLK